MLGFFTDTLTRYSGLMISVGWGALGFAVLAMLGQDKLNFGKSRSRLIRQLDEIRRSVGLDRVILPESLEFLEKTAQQWERIEHALSAQVWLEHADLRLRISEAAQRTMEDLVVLECGSLEESGVDDESANQTLSETAGALARLADLVDAVSAALVSYPREGYESNGASPEGVVPDADSLELALSTLISHRVRDE